MSSWCFMAFYGHTRALNFCASKTKQKEREKNLTKDQSYQDVHLGKKKSTHTHFLFDPRTLTSVSDVQS